jgi:YHS domain-containing protein
MTMTTAANPVTEFAQLMCESKVDPKGAPRMLYQGRTYYFCSEQDRAEFAKNPAKHVKAPAPQAAPTHAH